MSVKAKLLSLLKSLGLVVLFVGLLSLPSLGRTWYYYRRPYVPPEVARPDHAAVDVPTVGVAAFEDVTVHRGEGRAVIIHDDAVDDAELNVLRARLTARGIEVVSGRDALTDPDALAELLRTAVGLIVISPHEPFSSEATQVVGRFVEQGGRVLLVGDPSRYSLESEYDEVYGEVVIPVSDAAALNSVGAQFGLAFADDYLYNTRENAGNYQYVVLRDFAKSSITAGLEKVVFYAAHSIAADEETLVTADAETTSSLSEQTGSLAAVGIGGGGRVLAVGDLTFMTEPYNSTADNGRLVANIADFVGGARRTYGLADFPLFYGDQVDLIPLPDPADDAVLSAVGIAQVSSLESALESAGKLLQWQTGPAAEHDALYFGLYSGMWLRPEVEDLLASQGISFTLETAEQEMATPTPTPRFTPTPTSTPEEGEVRAPTPTPRPLRDWIHVPGLGRVNARETVLFYQNEEEGRQVVIVLAFGEDGLAAAAQRLVEGSFADCLLDEDLQSDPQAVALALCPTAYEPPLQATPTPTPEDQMEPTPTPVAEGGILIVSDDDGEGVYEWWTSAYMFYDSAIEAGYQVMLWSTAIDGDVTLEQMLSYDAVIWCTGDYREEGSTPEEDDLSNLVAYLDSGGRMVLSGAFVGSAEGSESGILVDVQVVQAEHPLLTGFEEGQIIVLERFTADEDYATYLLTEEDPEAILFARGPDSEFAGEAAVVLDGGYLNDGGTLWIGFPIFLFPYDDGMQLADNAVAWAMGE